MGLRSLYESLDAAWRGLLVIAAAFAVGSSCTLAVMSLIALPAEVASTRTQVATLSQDLGVVAADVASIRRDVEAASDDRDELRCLFLANYRGGGIEECLQHRSTGHPGGPR